MIPYTPNLTTLARVREYRRHETAETEDNALLTSFIEGASAGVARATGRVFVPYKATYAYDALGAHIGGFSGVADTFYMDDDDLLEVTTLTNGDTTVIAGSAYALYPANTYPKNEIRLKGSSGVSFTYTTDWEQAITLAGWWGCVPHYATAWKSATQLNGAVNASVTTLTVDTTTLIEIGGYVKADSEIMRVTAGSGTSYTVVRGELGTTAASHLDDAAVTVYQFSPDMQHAVTEIVSYLYKNKDNIGEQVRVYEGGIMQVSGLDPDVKATIARYQRATYTAV